jgi:pimeloyl-ACP methyl ester carboxylesterase
MTTYHTATVDGLKLFYREAGPPDAPIVVLLHGFPASSHMFRDLIPRLSDRFHLVAPDYPGFGNSDCPPADRFDYSFDHLAAVVEKFLSQLGLVKFSVYMQDYGGPVGFRIAAKHPDWITALIIQHANVYREGIQPLVYQQLRPLWEGRTAATEASVLKMFERDSTMVQYRHGARAPERMNPDAWNMDQYGLDRPGNSAIQLDLLANYHTNLDRYPEWQAYLKQHQPPALVVWGKNDPFFGTANADLLGRDLTDVEVHMLETGHFALEEDCEVIAGHIRRFLEARA